MKWNEKRVLVTGAAGFIGSHLCEGLVTRGAKVTAFVHYDSRPELSNLEYLPSEVSKALQVVKGDVRDPGFVSRAVKGQDLVFNLAALIAIPHSYTSPHSYLRTNIEGTLNVLEACRNFEVERLVQTSTSEVYGTAVYTPIDERHPLQGQSPYSASKIASDKMAESYYSSFGLPVVTLRPFNTYGPRQSARAIIPTIISQGLTQPKLRLGNLSPVRDLNFVKDTVSAFMTLAEAPDEVLGGVYNAGTGKGITIGDLAETILKLLDVSKDIEVAQERLRPEKSEVFELICDATALREVSGWKAEYSLEDGLLETIDFIRENPDFCRPTRYET